MSIQSEITRITNNVQDTIDVIEQTGVSVPAGANSDNLPSLAQALANEKQDKLTGRQGQVVGFDAEGNAVAQDQGASNVSADNVSVPDSTASLYGLEDATVDQVLQILKNAAVVNGAGDALETILGSTLLSIPGVNIATGSYVGTGTYGASNPNTLTFDFEPKVWGVYSHVSHIDNNSYVTLYDKNIFPWGINTEEFEIAINVDWTISFDGNKANWYGTNATYQRNSSGTMYYYFAIG